MIATRCVRITESFTVNGNGKTPRAAPASGDEPRDGRCDRAACRMRPRASGHGSAHGARGVSEWRGSAGDRSVQIFYKYKTLLDSTRRGRADSFTENARHWTDSRMSVQRAIQMVEVACGMHR